MGLCDRRASCEQPPRIRDRLGCAADPGQRGSWGARPDHGESRSGSAARGAGRAGSPRRRRRLEPALRGGPARRPVPGLAFRRGQLRDRSRLHDDRPPGRGHRSRARRRALGGPAGFERDPSPPRRARRSLPARIREPGRRPRGGDLRRDRTRKVDPFGRAGGRRPPLARRGWGRPPPVRRRATRPGQVPAGPCSPSPPPSRSAPPRRTARRTRVGGVCTMGFARRIAPVGWRSSPFSGSVPDRPSKSRGPIRRRPIESSSTICSRWAASEPGTSRVGAGGGIGPWSSSPRA